MRCTRQLLLSNRTLEFQILNSLRNSNINILDVYPEVKSYITAETTENIIRDLYYIDPYQLLTYLKSNIPSNTEFQNVMLSKEFEHNQKTRNLEQLVTSIKIGNSF